jgi:hypothetical protein
MHNQHCKHMRSQVTPVATTWATQSDTLRNWTAMAHTNGNTNQDIKIVTDHGRCTMQDGLLCGTSINFDGGYPAK